MPLPYSGVTRFATLNNNLSYQTQKETRAAVAARVVLYNSFAMRRMVCR